MIEDEEIRAALAAIRSALVDAGHFAFETRNPRDRASERWPAEYSGEVIDASGAPVHQAYRVERPIEGGVVRSISVFTSRTWNTAAMSEGVLRYVDAETLASFLAGAGLVVEAQFGARNRSPLTNSSPEIITIARGARERAGNREGREAEQQREVLS